MRISGLIFIITLLPSLSFAGQFIPSCRQALQNVDFKEVAQSAHLSHLPASDIPWDELEFDSARRIDRTTIGGVDFSIYNTVSIQRVQNSRHTRGILTFFVEGENCAITHANYIHNQ